MEQSGRNQWQPVTNGTVNGLNVCRGTMSHPLEIAASPAEVFAALIDPDARSRVDSDDQGSPATMLTTWTVALAADGTQAEHVLDGIPARDHAASLASLARYLRARR